MTKIVPLISISTTLSLVFTLTRCPLSNIVARAGEQNFGSDYTNTYFKNIRKLVLRSSELIYSVEYNKTSDKKN